MGQEEQDCTQTPNSWNRIRPLESSILSILTNQCIEKDTQLLSWEDITLLEGQSVKLLEGLSKASREVWEKIHFQWNHHIVSASCRKLFHPARRDRIMGNTVCRVQYNIILPDKSGTLHKNAVCSSIRCAEQTPPMPEYNFNQFVAPGKQKRQGLTSYCAESSSLSTVVPVQQTLLVYKVSQSTHHDAL